MGTNEIPLLTSVRLGMPADTDVGDKSWPGCACPLQCDKFRGASKECNSAGLQM